jgi:hypothetical protein
MKLWMGRSKTWSEEYMIAGDIGLTGEEPTFDPDDGFKDELNWLGELSDVLLTKYPNVKLIGELEPGTKREVESITIKLQEV